MRRLASAPPSLVALCVNRNSYPHRFKSSYNGWCNKMKLTLEELHEFILKICEKLSSHDLHSQEHVDGLVEKIQNETTDKNIPAPPAS